VLTRVFPPELVDRVVEHAGVRERRRRTLPARVMVCYLLAMALVFSSSYTEVTAVGRLRESAPRARILRGGQKLLWPERA